MNKTTQLIISVTIGVVFIIMLVFLIQINPCPSDGQYNLYRIVMSVAVAAFASILPGSFEFRYQRIVTATGTMGVFAFVYLYNPAQLIVGNNACSDIPVSLSGTVFINNKETKGVEIRINQLRQTVESDMYGSFRIDFPKSQNKKSFNLRILYQSSLDTSFELAKDNWNDLKFYFKADKNKIAINVQRDTNKNTTKMVTKLLNKRSIQNFFVGELPRSTNASYGGGNYCLYNMQYKDVKVQIKLSDDEKTVETAKVTFKINETANAGCPYQTAAPNTHIYDLSNGTINGNSIFITFKPDRSNNPLCSLSMSGTIQDDKIILSLFSERIDMPDPVLVYKIRMDMQAEKPQLFGAK